MTTKILSGLRLGQVFGVAAMGTALLFAGCDTDQLLEVVDSENVTPATLDDPALINVIYAGAIGEFATAYAGSGGDAYLSSVAVFTDELFSTGTFGTRTATDRRNQYTPADGNLTDGAYINLHQARHALRDGSARVEGWEGTSHEYFQEMKALEGYTILTLAEGFCGPLPFSQMEEDGSFTYGVPISIDETLDLAISKFNAAGSSDLTSVGTARALLSKRDYSGAGAAVAGVPTSFVYHIPHSVNGDRNALYSLQGNGRYSLSDVEGGNGLPFRSAMDPRVPWYRDPDQPDGFDEDFPLYKSKRHYAYDAPLPLATGVEARLIQAEAALAAGDGGAMVGYLNDLRADWENLMLGMFPGVELDAGATLDPLTDPGTADARRDLLFYEKAFWLFGTAHRQGDMRRLVRDYGVNQATIYPSGSYHKGGDHGSDIVFPLDFEEEGNNPNYEHSMCNVLSGG
jgi:hypothetical protein